MNNQILIPKRRSTPTTVSTLITDILHTERDIIRHSVGPKAVLRAQRDAHALLVAAAALLDDTVAVGAWADADHAAFAEHAGYGGGAVGDVELVGGAVAAEFVACDGEGDECYECEEEGEVHLNGLVWGREDVGDMGYLRELSLL